MKTKIRVFIPISIFILLVTAGLLLVRPIYFKIRTSVTDFASSIKESLEENLSMKINYESLSPSILTSVNIREITLSSVKEDQTLVEIAQVEKIRLDYSLIKLLKKDYRNGVKSLVVDGIHVQGNELFEFIKSNYSPSDEKKIEKKSESPNLLSFSPFLSEVPINLTIKNVSLFYETDSVSAQVSFKRMKMNYQNDLERITLVADAFFRADYNKTRYSGNLTLDSKLFNNFDGSTASICVSNLTDGNLRLNKMNFLFSFDDSVLSCTTIKNTFPLGFEAFYDIQNKHANLSINTRLLSLSSFVQSSKQDRLLKTLEGLKLTTSTEVSYYAEENSFEYKTDNSILIPDTILYSGAVGTLNISGDQNKVSVNRIELHGEKYDVSGNLELLFKNLNLSGFLDVTKFELQQGANISAEVYFDPLDKGFMAFIPQVFIDESAYTALQLTAIPVNDSVDFSFEGYDYSHFEADEPGRILIDGSFISSDKYLQTSVSINSFYLDSVLKTAISFLPEENRKMLQNLPDSAKTFMFSGDGYVSSDFSSVSFNVPYILLANTASDNQALMLSFDGNEQSIYLSQADLILGKLAFYATGSLDVLPDTREKFFLLDMNSGDIPYHFSGTVSDSVLNIMGDYNSEIRFDFSNPEFYSGVAICENLPFSVLDTSILTSVQTDVTYSVQDGIQIALNRLEVEEAGNKMGTRPRISVGGNINRYGASFDSIVFSDLYSQLDGSADVFFAKTEDTFASGGMNLKMKNPLSEEFIKLDISLSNPDMVPLTLENIKKNFYFDLQGLVNRLSMNRFTRINSNNNELTASLYASGTFEHPYVSASLDNLSIMLFGDAMQMHGSAIIEETDLTINDFIFNYRDVNINQVSGNFSLDSFLGDLAANVDAVLMDESFHAPLKVEVKDVIKQKGKILPSDFTTVISSEGLYGSLLKKNLGFSIAAMFSPDGVNVLSSDNLGLFAFFHKKTGDLLFDLNCKNTAKIHFEGFYDQFTNYINWDVSQIDVNLKELTSPFNLSKAINIYSGMLTGSLHVDGTLESPLFSGNLSVLNPSLNLPGIVSEKITTDKLILDVVNSEVTVHKKKLSVKKGEVIGSCKILFDKWNFDHLEANLYNEPGKFVPVDLKLRKDNAMGVVGDANLNLDLYLERKNLDVTGKIFAENAEFGVELTKMISQFENRSSLNLNVALEVNMGTHVRLTVDPVLRAIFVPGGKLNVGYESDSQVVLDGKLFLKSGDVGYLNRNFYIKEGYLKFSTDDEGFNPLMTVRAETRERDSNGESVTISLSAENQYLLDFSPRFTAVPAKSEAEIQSLLGQIMSGDSDSVGTFLFSAGDYAIQSFVGRKFENTLRDFFNFDIFSLRTNIIQNTLSYGLTQQKDKQNRNAISAGNFFDNSTVYIGKYLGSALYVDAMLNFQYDEKRVGDTTTVGGLIFKPEFGLELESPFVNIRWSVAPDIDAIIHKQYVPSSSLSLSWKFSF